MGEESKDSRSGVTWLSSGTGIGSQQCDAGAHSLRQNSVTVRWKMDIGVKEFGNAELK